MPWETSARTQHQQQADSWSCWILRLSVSNIELSRSSGLSTRTRHRMRARSLACSGMRRHADPGVRRMAVLVLGVLGKYMAGLYAAQIAELVSDGDVRVQSEAANALRRIGLGARAAPQAAKLAGLLAEGEPPRKRRRLSGNVEIDPAALEHE